VVEHSIVSAFRIDSKSQHSGKFMTIKRAALVLGFIAMTLGYAANGQGCLEINTKGGKIRGVCDSTNGIVEFKEIPYA
jgi:hypothetical protein